MKIRIPGPVLIPSILAVAALAGCATKAETDFYGGPAPTSAAERTIVIQPNTKWVNVTGGEIVKFVVNDKAFAWDFFVASGINSFELNKVAPPGVLDHVVTAYVAPDPRYIGADGVNM